MPKSRNSKSVVQRRRQGAFERLKDHIKHHEEDGLESHKKELDSLNEKLK